MSIRVAGLLVLALSVAQGAVAENHGEARVIVTVADHRDHSPKTLRIEDIDSVGFSMKLVGVEPASSNREVYLLIDDAASFDFGEKLQELQRFVSVQPSATAIGVAFITEGELKVAQLPTRDHDLAMKALRAPKGGKLPSSFCALSSLILGWPSTGGLRDVVMVTSGTDESEHPGAVCTNAEMAIADAQQAGVGVYAIYHPVADYAKRDWGQVDESLIELSHVCYETGGEAYFISHGPSEMIEPFLSDISEHLANQYLLTIELESVPESGLQTLFLDTGVGGPDLMAPARVWFNSIAGH